MNLPRNLASLGPMLLRNEMLGAKFEAWRCWFQNDAPNVMKKQTPN